MRVLVTGGAGFIGSGIARHLSAAGHDVHVLDDLSTGSAGAIPDGVPLIEADVASPDAVEAVAILRPEVIVHAAAQVSVARSVADPGRDHAVNVDGMRHVVAGARAAGASRVVFLSSGGAIYGDTDGADEETTPAPESPYGAHKLEAEDALRASGLGHAVARLANVYGPGQRSDLEGGVVAIFAERLLAGEPIVIHGDGLQRRDLVHVDDVVAAVARMARHGADGTWNVGTGRSTTILELLERMERRFRVRVRRTHAPVRDGDVRVSRLVVDRIARDLGWVPALDLEAGIDRLAASLGR